MSAEIHDVHVLLDWIKEVRWCGDVITFRFRDGFDASSYWIEERGRLLFHIGPQEHRDAIRRLSLLFCRCFDAAGAEIDTFVIIDLQRQYRTDVGGKTVGTDWMRFVVPPGTTRCFFFDLFFVAGTWHSIGTEATLIEKTDSW